VVDLVRPLAYYQLETCPISVTDLVARDGVLLVAYAEEGVRYVDLTAQGLPSTGSGNVPFELVASSAFDTLPGDSDTVLENYPCHPVGLSDGCESLNEDWNPSPCLSPGDPAAAFRVVMNAGFRSASAVDWSGCRVYVTDQGTPDADGLPHPSHVGAPQGLWVFDFAPDVGWSLRVERTQGDATSLTLEWDAPSMTTDYQVHRGTISALRATGYDHECLARTTTIPFERQDQISDPVTPRPNYYYLIASECVINGSVGRDSFGVERPGSPTACP
jgi:hypothetical protein